MTTDRTADDEGRTVQDVNAKYAYIMPAGYGFGLSDDGTWFLHNEDGNDVAHGSHDPHDEIKAAMEKANGATELQSTVWTLEREKKRWEHAIGVAGINPAVNYTTTPYDRIADAIKNEAVGLLKRDPDTIIRRAYHVPYGAMVSTGPNNNIARVLGFEAEDKSAWCAIVKAVGMAEESMREWARKVGPAVTPSEAADIVVVAKKEAHDARIDAGRATQAAIQIIHPIVTEAIAKIKEMGA